MASVGLGGLPSASAARARRPGGAAGGSSGPRRRVRQLPSHRRWRASPAPIAAHTTDPCPCDAGDGPRTALGSKAPRRRQVRCRAPRLPASAGLSIRCPACRIYMGPRLATVTVCHQAAAHSTCGLWAFGKGGHADPFLHRPPRLPPLGRHGWCARLLVMMRHSVWHRRTSACARCVGWVSVH